MDGCARVLTIQPACASATNFSHSQLGSRRDNNVFTAAYFELVRERSSFKNARGRNRFGIISSGGVGYCWDQVEDCLVSVWIRSESCARKPFGYANKSD